MHDVAQVFIHGSTKLLQSKREMARAEKVNKEKQAQNTNRDAFLIWFDKILFSASVFCCFILLFSVCR